MEGLRVLSYDTNSCVVNPAVLQFYRSNFQKGEEILDYDEFYAKHFPPFKTLAELQAESAWQQQQQQEQQQPPPPQQQGAKERSLSFRGGFGAAHRGRNPIWQIKREEAIARHLARRDSSDVS